MQFLDPTKASDEDFKAELLELSQNSIFPYAYLIQEVRRAHMEDMIILVTDPEHHIDIPRWRYEQEGPEVIIEFTKKWAPYPQAKDEESSE